MKKENSKTKADSPNEINVFKQRSETNPMAPANAAAHVYGKDTRLCTTDSRGYATPRNRDPAELVLDTSEGFIPLWAEGVNLRWRFSPQLLNFFLHPTEAMQVIRRLLADAILAWGDSSPVSFSERDDAWDFEIVVRPDNCTPNGCTLASAFFPDSGRHKLTLHPMMFSQSREEQVETLIHELGHIFGLRHFFANVSETAWSSVVFGEHRPFTIMNYGAESVLTETDKSDLKKLYEGVWNGEITQINGTRIVTFVPYHTFGIFVQSPFL